MYTCWDPVYWISMCDVLLSDYTFILICCYNKVKKKISKQDDLIHDSQLIHTSRNLLIKSNRFLCQLFWFLTDLCIIYVDTLWINYYKKISELYVLISDWPLISASFHQASSSLVVGFRPIRKAASFSSFFDSRPSSFESIR